MLESLKAWVFNAVVVIVAASVSAAWYFYSLSKRLKDQLFAAKADKQLGDIASKMDEVHKATLTAEEKYEKDKQDFNNALDELDSSHKPGGTVH